MQNREVMIREQSTSRATPTGEFVPLGAELHSDMERLAERPLTPEEAAALDRARLEHMME